GTTVTGVRNAVLVVVELGAAVGVFEAVLILGLARALIELVGNRVEVVVVVGTAVAVFVTVFVLGLGRALIGGAFDAVAVAVLAFGHVQHAQERANLGHADALNDAG